MSEVHAVDAAKKQKAQGRSSVIAAAQTQIAQGDSSTADSIKPQTAQGRSSVASAAQTRTVQGASSAAGGAKPRKADGASSAAEAGVDGARAVGRVRPKKAANPRSDSLAVSGASPGAGRASGRPLAAQGVFAFVARLIGFGRDFRAFCSHEADGLGVTLHEIDVLMALDELPGPSTVTAISARSHVSKGTISQAVESLRQKGLVSVAGDVHDRRRLLVAPTEKAQPILSRLYDAVRECLEISFSDLPDAQWDRLRTLFHELRDMPLPLEPPESKS